MWQLFLFTPVSCFCLRRVVQHPDQAPLPSLWAHHEKMVVIDQSAVLFTQGSAASRSSSAPQPMGSPREDGRRWSVSCFPGRYWSLLRALGRSQTQVQHKQIIFHKYVSVIQGKIIANYKRGNFAWITDSHPPLAYTSYIFHLRYCLSFPQTLFMGLQICVKPGEEIQN